MTIDFDDASYCDKPNLSQYKAKFGTCYDVPKGQEKTITINIMLQHLGKFYKNTFTGVSGNSYFCCY